MKYIEDNSQKPDICPCGKGKEYGEHLITGNTVAWSWSCECGRRGEDIFYLDYMTTYMIEE